MCAGKECYWVAYTFSGFKCETYDANFQIPQSMPPRKRLLAGRMEQNPDYDYPLFKEMRKAFKEEAHAEGSKSYKASSSGDCEKGCTCSILDGLKPKDIKSTTFSVPFSVSRKIGLVVYKLAGTYKVTASKYPAMCVPGNKAKTPISMDAFPQTASNLFQDDAVLKWQGSAIAYAESQNENKNE